MSTNGRKRDKPIRAGEIMIRLAKTREFPQWDRLMRKHHKLGFKRFAGRGLRYIVEYQGHWVALSGWQTSSLKLAPRDQWIGWQRGQQWQRLHAIANNTRFAMLYEAGGFPNLGSHVLKVICQRISDDWEEAYGHGLVLVETFVNEKQHQGTMYHAAGWQALGETAGYSRKSGEYTEAHDEVKRILVKSVRRDARRILCQVEDLPLRYQKRGKVSGHSIKALESLYADLSQMRDFRRAQGRKHTLACSFAILILAQLSKFNGCLAAAQFAAALSQDELKAVGGWYNKNTGLYEPPSKSTLHRVIQYTDPEQLQEVLQRYDRECIDHLAAVAGDGKRIRGANRNGESYYETVTLVEHGTGAPKASVSYHRKGEELEATRKLLTQTDICGRLVTLDALHTTHETVGLILDGNAHYMLTLKDNSSLQLDKAKSMRWSSHKVRHYSEDLDKAHGRLEQRHIAVLEVDNPKCFDFTGVRQVFRIERDREVLKEPGSASTETVFGITSVPSEKADAAQLLARNRGHWTVEANHHIRDKTFAEDDGLTRTNNGTVNRAMCNNIALALIIRDNRFDSVPQALRHFNLHRKEAITAIVSAP